MTIKEGIYDIREAYHSHSADSELINRHIYFLMVAARRRVIREHIGRKPGEWRDQMTQSLIHQLEDITIGATHYLRSLTEVPLAIGEDIFKKYEIRPLGLVQKEIQLLHSAEATYAEVAPKGLLYATIKNDRRLYILNNLLIKSVEITSILEDPKDAEIVTDAEVTDFYLPTNMWLRVKALVMQNLQQGISLDTLDDNKDSQQLVSNAK
jgi:hypothetical protein